MPLSQLHAPVGTEVKNLDPSPPAPQISSFLSTYIFTSKSLYVPKSLILGMCKTDFKVPEGSTN